MESRGVILFNRGENCVLRAAVCLYTLRKYWNGGVTFYLEKPYPVEFDNVCKYFNVDIIHNEEKHELVSLVRKTDMFGNPPYDRTLWLDADIVVCNNFDDMLGEYLDNTDVCIPNFCDWISTGHTISKRIRQFKGIAEDRHYEKALQSYPAINTGVLSFKRSDKWKKFVEYWVHIADLGSKKHIFIADEIAAQVLFPSMDEWGLKCYIAPKKYNVSVRYGEDVEDKRLIHFHGRKHCANFKLCDIWKKEFKEMTDNNIADINSLLPYTDKRLKIYLNGGKPLPRERRRNRNKTPHTPQVKVVELNNTTAINNDVTFVSACDPNYVKILAVTYPNWRKYKNIDNYPVIIFVNGMDVNIDPRLDFLRLPNVTLIPWSKENDLDGVTEHREEMLSAFVFGSARYVKTKFWIKLDADSYAVNSKPIYTESMKKYSLFSHKWSYSRPSHIQQLDEWAKTHSQRKLRLSQPMIEQGKIEGNRFYHNTNRIISYVCFQKTRFTQFCVKLLKDRKLPCPSQDTYAYFIIQKFNPEAMGTGNFKRHHGFVQGRGKSGADNIKAQIDKVDMDNGLVTTKPIVPVIKKIKVINADNEMSEVVENKVENNISPLVSVVPVVDPNVVVASYVKNIKGV